MQSASLAKSELYIFAYCTCVRLINLTKLLQKSSISCVNLPPATPNPEWYELNQIAVQYFLFTATRWSSNEFISTETGSVGFHCAGCARVRPLPEGEGTEGAQKRCRERPATSRELTERAAPRATFLLERGRTGCQRLPPRPGSSRRRPPGARHRALPFHVRRGSSV